MLACCNNGFLSINSSEHVIWGDPSLTDFHRNRLHREAGIIKNDGFAVPRCWHRKRSWLCYMIMFALQKNGFAVAILKDHGFTISRHWHHKRSYLRFIMMLASKRFISLRYQSRAPTKWRERWLLINYLILLSFPCHISRLAYIPLFIQVCEPVSQKVCGTVEVAVPRYHQTTSNWAPKCCHHIHHI